MSHDLIVLRAPSIPGFAQEGWWYDLNNMPKAISGMNLPPGKWSAFPMNRFETRDSDGAVAEVWEIQRAD